VADFGNHTGRIIRFRRKRRAGPLVTTLVLLISFSAGVVISQVTASPASSPASSSVSFAATVNPVAYARCRGGLRINCVVDGDTLWIGGVKIRVADIDTPEIGTPGCAYEKALGEKATGRLIQLVNAGPFETRKWPNRDADRYGRKLRVLVRDGRSLGDVLVSEGLARAWTGRRLPWC
jgi:endonuclease YncB( thermonuclease family)